MKFYLHKVQKTYKKKETKNNITINDAMNML